MASNCSPSTCIPLLEGMTDEELRALLAALRQAYFALITGRREVTVSYAQGDGAKSVTYNNNNVDLTGINYMIRYISMALGISCVGPRRAIAVAFP